MNEQVHYVIFDTTVNEYVVNEEIFNSVREASRSMTQADEEIHAVRVGTNGELIDLDRPTSRKDEPKDGPEDEPEIEPDFEFDTRIVCFYGKTLADTLRKLAAWCSQNSDECQEIQWNANELRPYFDYFSELSNHPYVVSIIVPKGVSGEK